MQDLYLSPTQQAVKSILDRPECGLHNDQKLTILGLIAGGEDASKLRQFKQNDDWVNPTIKLTLDAANARAEKAEAKLHRVLTTIQEVVNDGKR